MSTKRYIIRPYFGRDCSSVDGFNDGYYLEPVEVDASCTEDAIHQVMQEYRRGGGDVVLPLHGVECIDGDMLQWCTLHYNTETGEEITEEQFREYIGNSYETSPDTYAYRYQYIDFGADVSTLDNMEQVQS